MITPRLIEIIEQFNRRIHKERLANESHLAEQVAKDQVKTVATTAEDPERPVGAVNEGAGEDSTSSYNTESNTGDNLTYFNPYHNIGQRTTSKHLKVEALFSCASWRKKYRIGVGIKIFHGSDLNTNPYLNHTIIFYEGFLPTGIRLPLLSLTISFFNYTRQAPQQFPIISFVALVMFDYLNGHKDYGNGELKLGHFLYYYQLACSSGSNKPHIKGKDSQPSPLVAIGIFY